MLYRSEIRATKFLVIADLNVYFKYCGSLFAANYFGLADLAQAVNKADPDFFNSEHSTSCNSWAGGG
jgi:polysaccharide deacetylase 2 family uncharacterized protein YibQ